MLPDNHPGHAAGGRESRHLQAMVAISQMGRLIGNATVRVRKQIDRCLDCAGPENEMREGGSAKLAQTYLFQRSPRGCNRRQQALVQRKLRLNETRYVLRFVFPVSMPQQDQVLVVIAG